MAADGRIDRAAGRHDADADRLVLALDVVNFQRPTSAVWASSVRAIDQQATRILVQPMHDAAARQMREVRVEMQQRVLQRSCRIAGARMHDQAGGFVDDQDMLVLMHDIQRRSTRGATATASRQTSPTTSIRSPPRTLSLGRNCPPFTRIWPDSIQSLMRVREYSDSNSAST